MRQPATIAPALACLALAAAQSLGLHLHLEADEQAAGAQSAHLQHHLSDEHDHGEEVDASKLELGNVWLKSLVFVLICSASLLLVIANLKGRWLFPATPIIRRWRRHWRPPLRAPPILV